MSSAGIYARCRSRCPRHRTPPAARSPSSDPACCSDSLRSLLPQRSSLLLHPDRHPRRPRAPPQPPYGLSPSREKPHSAGRTGTASAPAGDESASLSHGCAAAAPAAGGSVRGAALTGSRSRSGPRPARRGSGEREGQGRGSGESCGEQRRAASARATSAVLKPPQPCPAPPRGPSGCRWLYRAAALPEPRGFPRFPARNPPGSLLMDYRDKEGNRLFPASLSAVTCRLRRHRALPTAPARRAQLPSGITGRSARKHKKGNLLSCSLFVLHFEINDIPNAPTPENDDLPSPSPPFCILHRCGEAWS